MRMAESNHRANPSFSMNGAILSVVSLISCWETMPVTKPVGPTCTGKRNTTSAQDDGGCTKKENKEREKSVSACTTHQLRGNEGIMTRSRLNFKHIQSTDSHRYNQTTKEETRSNGFRHTATSKERWIGEKEISTNSAHLATNGFIIGK